MVRHPRHRKKALADIVQQIEHYASNIKKWTQEESLSIWLDNEQAVMAVGLSAQIIGEQANSLLLVWPDLLETESLQKWEAFRNLRHAISHAYDDMNLTDLYYMRDDADFLISWSKAIAERLPKIEKLESQKENPRKVFDA